MLKKILFPVLFILSVWFFVGGIAVDVYERNYILLTLIAGILTTGLLAMSLFILFPPAPARDGEKARVNDDFGCFLIILIVGWFFGFSIFLIYKSSGETKDELKDHGVYTIGTVIDGSSFKTRRVDMTDVTIEFETKEGTTIVTKADVPSGSFDNYYKGQQVQIVYSALHPRIIGIIWSDSDVERYTGIKVRQIRLDDLYKILDLKKGKDIEDYLNSICPKWEYQEGIEGESTYKNILKDIALKTNENGSLMYMEASSGGVNLIEYDLSKKGIEAQNMENIKLYKDGNYSILSKRERVMQNDGLPNGPARFVNLTTITKDK
jgi:hypothetical protein